MDAPLVLTTRIDPKEVDKEAHNIDVTAKYPLEFIRPLRKSKIPLNLKALWILLVVGFELRNSMSISCLHTTLLILLQALSNPHIRLWKHDR